MNYEIELAPVNETSFKIKAVLCYLLALLIMLVTIYLEYLIFKTTLLYL